MFSYSELMKKFLLIIALAVLIFEPYPTVFADDTLETHIQRMTLRQKIGQLMFIGFQGRTLSSKDIAYIKKINPGGIVFFARNFKDASEVAPLISNIQSISKDHGTPMFFAIDQEGGIVHRIGGKFHRPPSEPAIGAANSEELARKVGLSVGSALRSLGININLAPVLDVPSDILSSPMTGRSYSNDFRIVERLGIAYIKGLKDAGLLATAKHFPGIGRAHDDSHLRLPFVTWKTQYEKDNDIMPFKSAIRSGVDIIMVGHFIAEPGDKKNPVSLSPFWMKNTLRKDMGFEGLIVVDNIEMKPIEDIMPISEAAVQSFKAGADMIMVSHEQENQKAVFNALMEAVKKGDISQDRLDESLRRIISAKKRMTSHRINKVSAGDLNEISRLVAENSVIALKLKDAPSYTLNNTDKVLFTGYNLTLFNVISDGFRHTEIMNTTLVNYKRMNPGTPVAAFIRKFDALIIDAGYTDASGIISICDDLNLKYVMFLTHPWDIQKTIEKFKPKQIIITADGNSPSFKVAFEIIFGQIRAKGRLPYNFTLPVNYTYD
jgi:beta-N-acetylhexosaminidase